MRWYYRKSRKNVQGYQNQRVYGAPRSIQHRFLLFSTLSWLGSTFAWIGPLSGLGNNTLAWIEFEVEIVVELELGDAAENGPKPGRNSSDFELSFDGSEIFVGAVVGSAVLDFLEVETGKIVDGFSGVLAAGQGDAVLDVDRSGVQGFGGSNTLFEAAAAEGSHVGGLGFIAFFDLSFIKSFNGGSDVPVFGGFRVLLDHVEDLTKDSQVFLRALTRDTFDFHMG